MSGAVRIFRSLAEALGEFGPSALTVGNFDGAHAGHRRIFRRVAEVARERGLKASALTFDPHPTKVVAPQRSPRLLTTPEQRCRLMAQEGIRQALILPFTFELAQLSPEEFVKRILVDALGVKAATIGDNFRFGHKQAGDTKLLEELGQSFGFSTEVVPAVTIRGMAVSSSQIRRLIEAGDVSRACRLLERPYSIEGDVVHGHGIGSKQTVPTLNLATRAEVLPAVGVYVTRTHEGERSWPSVTNIGYRPTFGGSELSIETFLLAPLEGGTPQRIRIEFLRRLRDEKKFDSPEALKAQILRDVRRAQAYFRRVPCHNQD
jgi:riboflavin kinase/FMN adenylyltransferase